MKRCLYCYLELEKGQKDFHPGCSRKIFNHPAPPVLPYTEDQIAGLALQSVRNRISVPGVQPKLSLHLEGRNGSPAPKRFTITGIWEEYILKPQSPDYPQLPEVEDLTMHLASIAGIPVAPHSLFRMSTGLAYITKRMDRQKKGKLHMEDMCQLTGRLTEHKYQGSYEQVAKAILHHSENPGLDVVNFFELLLFSFLTGNADMHLKNFSLLKIPEVGYTLSPGYDLISTALVNPADNEEMALTLNGKKKKITRNDFVAAFRTLNLNPKQQENIFNKMIRAKADWMDFIDISFISREFKHSLKDLVNSRLERIKG